MGEYQENRIRSGYQALSYVPPSDREGPEGKKQKSNPTNAGKKKRKKERNTNG
jgi:hypothetical protein